MLEIKNGQNFYINLMEERKMYYYHLGYISTSGFNNATEPDVVVPIGIPEMMKEELRLIITTERD
jgi:hypothetical protein